MGHPALVAGVAGVASVVCGLGPGPRPASAGTIRDDVPDSSYTGLAAQARYAAVGDFRRVADDTFCSGTLISPEWILTAAHCCDNNGRTFTVGGVTYDVDEWIAHPNYVQPTDGTSTEANQSWDVGLAHLSRFVKGVSPVERYTGNSEVGLTATYVGFGRTGDGLTGATQAVGTKRAGQNVIDGTAGSARTLNAFFNRPGEDSVLPLEVGSPGTELEFAL